jgi:regulator of protease activity HflC (stomatin/prohibitin superfamily)
MWFILAVVFVVVMLVLTRRQWNPRADEIDIPVLTRKLAKYFTVGLLVAFFMTFLEDAVVIVPAGHRGVIFDRFKGIQSKQLNEGMNFIIPFAQEATIFDVRVQKVEFDATAASKDMQSVRTKVALNYHPIPEEVPNIFKQYGLGYGDKVVHPAVQEAVKAATARYTAEELITKREEVKTQIHEILTRHVGQAHLRLVETYITDFEFSSEFAHAIEAKQIAEQQALKARRDLDRVKIEAEQKVAQARAEAEGLRMQKEAITPQLVELRKIEAQKLAIEKWDGKLPNVMMGQSTPFVNVSDLTKSPR